MKMLKTILFSLAVSATANASQIMSSNDQLVFRPTPSVDGGTSGGGGQLTQGYENLHAFRGNEIVFPRPLNSPAISKQKLRSFIQSIENSRNLLIEMAYNDLQKVAWWNRAIVCMGNGCGTMDVRLPDGTNVSIDKKAFYEKFFSSQKRASFTNTIRQARFLFQETPCLERVGTRSIPQDAAIYRSAGGESRICVSMSELEKKIVRRNQLPDVVALIFHEMSHLANASEAEATALQSELVYVQVPNNLRQTLLGFKNELTALNQKMIAVSNLATNRNSAQACHEINAQLYSAGKKEYAQHLRHIIFKYNDGGTGISVLPLPKAALAERASEKLYNLMYACTEDFVHQVFPTMTAAERRNAEREMKVLDEAGFVRYLRNQSDKVFKGQRALTYLEYKRAVNQTYYETYGLRGGIVRNLNPSVTGGSLAALNYEVQEIAADVRGLLEYFNQLKLN